MNLDMEEHEYAMSGLGAILGWPSIYLASTPTTWLDVRQRSISWCRAAWTLTVRWQSPG